MTLSFMKGATYIGFIGPNGVGKSTLALNIAYQALIRPFRSLPHCHRFKEAN